MSSSDADTQNVDRLIHEPSRLTIMMHLYVVESADFQFLQKQTGMTPGNSSRTCGSWKTLATSR